MNQRVKEVIIGVLSFCLGFIAAAIGFVESESVSNANTQEIATDKSIINSKTFAGEWAFTVDSVKLKHVAVSPNLDGVEVIINGNTYGLTRNITNKEFLPDKYWKNGTTRQVGQEKVCDNLYIDENTCKIQLADVVNYASELPLEK